MADVQQQNGKELTALSSAIIMRAEKGVPLAKIANKYNLTRTGMVYHLRKKLSKKQIRALAAKSNPPGWKLGMPKHGRHWTQTAAGKRKMREMNRQRRLHGKSSGTSKGDETPGAESEIQYGIAYAFGHCEAWIEAYAASRGLSKRVLASGVGELLRRTPVRD
jgi:hypothetical protein